MDHEEWAFPPEFQPDADATRFDLDRALSAVVALDAEIPPDAFTAPILGTDRTGSAVVIREDGLAVTIGYLVTEASDVKLTTGDGRAVDAHPIAIDFVSGLGLVQPLGNLGVAPIARGSADALSPGDTVNAISHGGRHHAVEHGDAMAAALERKRARQPEDSRSDDADIHLRGLRARP